MTTSSRISPSRPRASGGAPATVPRGLVTAAGWAWRLLVLAGAVYLIARLVDLLSIVTVPLFLALLLTTLLVPARNLLQGWGLGRIAAAWTAFLVGIVLFLGLVAFIVIQAASSASRVVNDATNTLEDLRRLVHSSPLTRGLPLTAIQDRIASWLDTHRDMLVQTAVSGADITLRAIVGLFLTMVLTFLLLYDGDRLWRQLTIDTSLAWPRRVGAAGTAGWQALSGFVHGSLVIATFHGIVVGTTLAILGVPLAVVLAALVFIGSFVPLAGALVAGGFAVLVTLATRGPLSAAVVLAVLVGSNQVEAHVLQPLVMRRFARVHPFVTVVGIAALGSVWGITGALVAVPLAALINQSVPVLLRGSPEPAAMQVHATAPGGWPGPRTARRMRAVAASGRNRTERAATHHARRRTRMRTEMDR